MPPHASKPVKASFPSDKLTIVAGVAIFHVATERVVVCYHSRDRYWFLPKGRRNANEATERAAEREGFEESGYRNRLIPLPILHRQPDPDEGHQTFVTEPIWTQLLPLSATSQYMLFWYAAETVTPQIEQSYRSPRRSSNAGAASRMYERPAGFPKEGTLRQRLEDDKIIEQDGKQGIYEPIWHPDTGVDEEERLYRSFLLPIADARVKLKGSVMEDVVRRAWEAIQLRMKLEETEGA